MATSKPVKQKSKPSPQDTKSENSPFSFEPVINWIVFGLYSIVVLYTTSCHEMWRDEAQSWLIARDNSLLGLFRYIPNEGHPPLWYLLLMPFAKLGFPYSTAGIISNIIAIIGAWLIIFKSRMPIYLRIGVVFSYYFLFEFAVIARNYGMVGTMLFAIIAVYEDRFKKPFLYAALIFLLFQTNVLAFCSGVALGLMFFIELIREKNFSAKQFIALGIMALGGLATIVLLLSAGMKSDYTAVAHDKMGIIIASFGNALFLDKTYLPGFILYLIIAAALFRKPMVLLFLGISLAGFCYLVVYKFQGTLRHHGLLLTFLAGAYALAVRYKPLKQFEKLNWVETGGAILFSLVLLNQAFKGIDFVKEDINTNFSDSKNAAAFINDNQLYNYTLVGHSSYAASAIVPYLPDHKAIWYADQQRFGTFLYLDTLYLHNYMRYSADYAPYIVQKDFKNLDSVILVMNMPIQYPDFVKQWDMIYHTTERPVKADEVYFIYKHKNPIAPAPVQPALK